MHFVSLPTVFLGKPPASFRELRKHRRRARILRGEIVRLGETFRLRPLIPVGIALAFGSALGLLFTTSEYATRAAPWLDISLITAQICAVTALLFVLKKDSATRQRGILPGAEEGRQELATILRARRKSRAAVLLMLFGLLVLTTALRAVQRRLPPPGDVSRLARLQVGAAEPPRVTLVGEIAAPPRYNEFTLEFPLRCRTVRVSGRSENLAGEVWVVLPRADAPENNAASKDEIPALTGNKSTLKYSHHSGDEFVAGDVVKIRARIYDLPRASNTGEVTRQSFYIQQGCWCIARAEKLTAVQKLQVAQGVARVLNETRRGIATLYENRLASARGEEKTAARPYERATSVLLTSLIFGEGGLREPLPRTTRERYRAAGLSHLLVASGTQISLLAAAAILLARLLGLRGVALVLCTALPLWFYSALAGGEASIARAAIAGFCVVAALSLGRAVDALSLWSLALGALLLLDPAQISNIGLQLSFAATWGLLALSPALRVLASRPASEIASPARGVRSGLAPPWLPAPLSFLLAVQMATLPVQLAHFGTLSAVALPSNALALPISACVSFFGVLALMFPVFATPAYLSTRSLDALCSLAAGAPGAQFSGLSISRGALFLAVLLPLAVCGAAAVSLALQKCGGAWRDLKTIARYEAARFTRRFQRKMRSPSHRAWKFVTALMVLGALLFLLDTRRAPLRVAFLDVGQGDSIVIRTPSGKTILIDGGSSDTRRGDVARGVIVPYLQSVGATQIDALVMTHADSDHCNALAGVMREVPTKLVIDGAAGTNATGDSSGEYSRLKRLWRAQKVEVWPAQMGQVIDCGDGVRLRVLAPRGGMNAMSENDRSAVMRLEFGEVSMLFTGDMEFEGEESLLQSGENLRATVLKVGHHGSRGASSAAFLKRVAPRVAVISCGRFNQYSHPAQDALSRLESSGAEIFRTDRDGEIEVSCDEKSCELTTFR